MIPALKDGFLRTDADFLTLAETATCKKVTESGSAVVTLLVTLEQLSVACAGDCRALLIKRDGTHVDLSTDHTAELHENSCVPLRPDEAERVSSTGGVMDHGVVWVGDNSLPMTRAVGDMHLKVAEGRNWHSSPADHQVVTALPEVQTCDRSANDLCVVLASDGVFGSVMSSAQVASLTMHELQQHRGLQDAEKRAAIALADSAYGQHHGSDNIGIVIVTFEARPRCTDPSMTLVQTFSLDSLSSTQSTSSIDSKIQLPFDRAYPPREVHTSLDEGTKMQPYFSSRTLGSSRRAHGLLGFSPAELCAFSDSHDLLEDMQ